MRLAITASDAYHSGPPWSLSRDVAGGGSGSVCILRVGYSHYEGIATSSRYHPSSFVHRYTCWIITILPARLTARPRPLPPQTLRFNASIRFPLPFSPHSIPFHPSFRCRSLRRSNVFPNNNFVSSMEFYYSSLWNFRSEEKRILKYSMKVAKFPQLFFK